MLMLTQDKAEFFLGPMLRAADELAHHDEEVTKSHFVARRAPFPQWTVHSPWLDEPVYGPANTEAFLQWVDETEERKPVQKQARECVDEFYGLRDELITWQLAAYRQAQQSMDRWWPQRKTCSLANIIGGSNADEILALSSRGARLWWSVEDLWIEFALQPREPEPTPPACPESLSPRAQDFYERLVQFHPATVDLNTVPYAFEAKMVGQWQKEINDAIGGAGWCVIPHSTGRFWMLRPIHSPAAPGDVSLGEGSP